MKIIERIRQWRHDRTIKAALKASRNPDPGNRRFRGGRFLSWLRGDYTISNSELLFAAISRIANALSAMPLQLYKGAEPARNNEVGKLIAVSPNGNTTCCNFIKTLEACRCSSGNCYAFKVLDDKGRLIRLDILDPSKVTPIVETGTKELWYRIRDGDGKEMYIHNYYMIHVPFLSTNGYTGINPVSVLYDTLSYSEDIQTFSRDQLSKGVSAAIVLEAPASLGENQRTELINSFMQTYRETSGNILLLESGITAKSMDMSPVDTKLFEVEKITRSKVAMVYNLPPHLLGDYSDTSFGSQEQQMLEFLMLTMLPIVTAYEQELDRKLLTQKQRDKGYHFKFDMDSILRADAATQAEVDYKNIRSGTITPDEVRARQHRRPYPGGIGNAPMISQDLATLDYTVNTKPKVLAAKLESTSSEPSQ